MCTIEPPNYWKKKCYDVLKFCFYESLYAPVYLEQWFDSPKNAGKHYLDALKDFHVWVLKFLYKKNKKQSALWVNFSADDILIFSPRK